MVDSVHRELILALAKEVLPGNDHQPAAIDVDISGEPLDRVLSSRPDLEGRLLDILERFAADESLTAAGFVATLDAQELRVLMTVFCGAYFLVREVRRAIAYTGQQALTLDRGGFGGEELAIKQMNLPKRYRKPPERVG
ncbi:MAG TPA: hypothetical protein DHW07_06765 [Gammaproteobacteria bacterium]|nr:hypothetical protein [Gammaproteobacteria bacterium]|tara:strand:+ start:195 stop:611 length:417 start_codon:yes stop_codon:yes gene_type:complete